MDISRRFLLYCLLILLTRTTWLVSTLGLAITPRPDLSALVARWQREITALELQAGYFAILAAAGEMNCWHWLLDLRRREELASP